MIRNRLLLFIYASINILFIIKYGSRVSDSPFAITLMCIAPAAIMIFILSGSFQRVNELGKIERVYLLVAAILMVCCIVLLIQIDPHSTRVGRYPAVNDWLEKFLSGKFPYGSPSFPSGFPGLFLILLPFQLTGEVGTFHLLTLAIFAWLCRCHFVDSPINALRSLLLFGCSLPFLYEVSVRSELCGNMILLILCFHIIISRSEESSKTGMILWGLLMGMVISTRGVVVLPLAVLIGYLLKRRLWPGTLFVTTSFLGFILTLLPLVVWGSESFREYGPFSIQLSHVPMWILPVAIPLGTYLGYRSQSPKGVYGSSALLLFGSVLTVFLIAVGEMGWTTVVLHDGFDISYFCFPVPFLLLGLDPLAGGGTDHSRQTVDLH